MRKRIDENKIYEVALKQFAKYGYKKTTLEEIADKLGMTGANLYSYTNSKQDLYHDSVSYGLKKWQNYVLDSLEGIDEPAERFKTLCSKSVEYLGKDKTFRTILKHDPDIFPMFPEADPYEEINIDSYRLLKDSIERGVAAGVFADVDIENCTRLLFTIYKTLIIETYIKDEEALGSGGIEETINVLMKGILKR